MLKCQLIGFHLKEGVDKKTGNPYKSCQLCFVRKPSLSESGFVGTVCFSTKVYDDSIKDLPELVVDAAYNVDCRQFNGKYYLDDMTSLK